LAKTGWIKLHRQIMDSKFYKEQRKFSKNEAWIDILLRTYHEDTIENKKGVDIFIPRGSFPVSIYQLSKAWKWDKKTVSSFIKYLVQENMITINNPATIEQEPIRKPNEETALELNEIEVPKNSPILSPKLSPIVSVVNWEFYQSASPKKSPNLSQKNPLKNESLPILFKEEKNIYSELFDFWNEQKIIKHNELTPEMEKAIDKITKELSVEQIKTCMTRYKKALDDESFFFTYRWSLVDFLNRKNGIKDFLDDGAKWVSYQNQNIKTEPAKTASQGTVFLDLEELENRWRE